MANNPQVKTIFEPNTPELREKQLNSLVEFMKDILICQNDNCSTQVAK